MSALIFAALREVDLGSVELVTIQGQRRQVTAPPNKIVLPKVSGMNSSDGPKRAIVR
jgi:hypothetical protein